MPKELTQRVHSRRKIRGKRPYRGGPQEEVKPEYLDKAREMLLELRVEVTKLVLPDQVDDYKFTVETRQGLGYASPRSDLNRGELRHELYHDIIQNVANAHTVLSEIPGAPLLAWKVPFPDGTTPCIHQLHSPRGKLTVARLLTELIAHQYRTCIRLKNRKEEHVADPKELYIVGIRRFRCSDSGQIVWVPEAERRVIKG